MTAAPYPADTRAKGWRFELDYEQIEQSSTWPLAAEVPMGQHALLMMWFIAWAQVPCGSFPNDEAVIRAKCRIPAATWSKCRDVLMRGWWLADDGRLYHDTVTKRVLEMMARRRSDADRKAAARAAKAADSGAIPHGVTGVSHRTSDGLHPESSTDNRQPITNTEAKASVAAKSPRGSRKCPKGFEPDSPDEFVAQHCPGVDWRRETDAFRDHTYNRAISDWQGAWRNWMRKATPSSRVTAFKTAKQRDTEDAAAFYRKSTGGLIGARAFDSNVIDMEVSDAAQIGNG